MPVPPKLSNRLVDTGDGPTLILADDHTFEGGWSQPHVPELVFANSALAGKGPAVFGSGPIATNAPVQLIYWGSFWESEEGRGRRPSLTEGMQRMIDSRYWSGLEQYGIQPPNYRGAMVVTEPQPPPRFHSDGDMAPVLDMIDALIDDERVPDPDDERIVYVVFMPREFIPPGKELGAHSSDYDIEFPYEADRYWAGWVAYFAPDIPSFVSNQPDERRRDPEKALMVASHELVGMLSSPEQDGWMIDGVHIPDAGRAPDESALWANVNGVRVNAYWSNRHDAAIIPIDRDYRARLRGVVEATEEEPFIHGTFRPQSTANLCHRNAACCIEDRDYQWAVMAVGETAAVRVEWNRYRSPGVMGWQVGGLPIKPDTSDVLDVPVQVAEYVGRSGLLPEIRTRPETVRIEYTQRGDTLTLSTRAAPAYNFDIDVACEVRDLSFRGMFVDGGNVVAKPRVEVGFLGQQLVIDPEYLDRWEACVIALVAELKENAMPDWRVPDQVDIDPTINPEVLARLPVWTRATAYQQIARAANLERLGRAMLPPDAAEDLTNTLLAHSPLARMLIADRSG